MSESINNVQNEKLLGGIAGSMGINALISRGFGAVPAIKATRDAKKVLNTQVPSKVVKEFIKKNAGNTDSFTKSIASARTYEVYSSALKSAAKAQKALNKIQSGKISLFKRLLNLGKSKQEILAKYTERNTAAKTALESLTDKLKSGKGILETKTKSGKIKTTNILGNSFKANMRGQFKEVMLNPMNLIYAVGTTWSRIQKDAIPAFKEKGVKEGIKQVGIAIGKSAADVLSNAGFSTVFKVLGMRIGAMISPAAASVAGTMGDMLGTLVSSKLITRAFGEDKPKNEAPVQQENNQREYTAPVRNVQNYDRYVMSNRMTARDKRIQKALYM